MPKNLCVKASGAELLISCMPNVALKVLGDGVLDSQMVVSPSLSASLFGKSLLLRLAASVLSWLELGLVGA